MNEISAVGYDSEEQKDKALFFARSLDFRLRQHADSCLFVTAERLALKMPRFSLLSADFSALTWLKRKAEGKKHAVVKACRPTGGLKIIDATAGWGRDAAILASFGAEVLMLERHPLMFVLLSDALVRQNEADQQQLHLSLMHDDSYSFLRDLSSADYPDVIYIDPMHPQRKKSALVKKDMQVLQQIIGVDEDALALITMAITRVKQRVVVKWPQKLPPLVPANACIDGKTVRFDIYTNSQ